MIAQMSPEAAGVIRKYLRDKKWAEENKYANCILDYINSGKNEYEKLMRLVGVLGAVEIVMSEDEQVLFTMLNRVASRRGLDLMSSVSDLADFRLKKESKN